MTHTLFVVSQDLSAKVSPEWRLHLGFGTQKKCPFPLNRAVPSISNRYKNYGNTFPGPNFVSPEWRRPLHRGVPKERFHCIGIL